jgi:hypothetical protein
MFRAGDVVLCIVSCSQRQRLGLREATPQEIAQWSAQNPRGVIRVNLSVEDAHALFTGHTLARAQRVAALTSGRFQAVFGEDGEAHYRLGASLRAIGKRLPVSTGGCGTCLTIASACGLECQRRLVNEALATAPFPVLLAAAEHVDPAAQLDAAAEARIAQQLKRRGGAATSRPRATT